MRRLLTLAIIGDECDVVSNGRQYGYSGILVSRLILKGAVRLVA